MDVSALISIPYIYYPQCHVGLFNSTQILYLLSSRDIMSSIAVNVGQKMTKELGLHRVKFSSKVRQSVVFIVGTRLMFLNLAKTKDRGKQFRSLISKYVKDVGTDNLCYHDEILNYLRCFINENDINNISSSISIDINIYLQISFNVVFHSIYHQYSLDIIKYDGNSNNDNNDSILPNLGSSTIIFMDILYDLIKLNIFNIPLMDNILIDLFRVIINLTKISIANYSKNKDNNSIQSVVWNNINVSLKLLTKICNHTNLSKQVMSILNNNKNEWKKLIQFIQYISAENMKINQVKLWLLSEKILKIIFNLCKKVNIDTIPKIFVNINAYNLFYDTLKPIISVSKSMNASWHYYCYSIIYWIIKILLRLLCSPTHSNIVNSICKDIKLWNLIKNYMINITSIIVENDNDTVINNKKMIRVNDFLKLYQCLIMVAIIPNDNDNNNLHLIFIDSTNLNLRIKRNEIILEHVIPIFITILFLNEKEIKLNIKQKLLIEIINIIKWILSIPNDDCSSILNQIFSLYPQHNDYKLFENELFDLLSQSLISQNIDDKMKQFIMELKSKLFQDNHDKIKYFIKSITNCTKEQPQKFHRILYELQFIPNLISLINHCDIPKLENLDIDCNQNWQIINNKIQINIESMHDILKCLSFIINDIDIISQFGMDGISKILSLCQIEIFCQDIFDIISYLLIYLDATHDIDQLSYFCHGIVIGFNVILQNEKVSILSKIFIMQYLQSISSKYQQISYSFWFINGIDTLLICLECNYNKPYIITNNDDDDILKLCLIQECILTLLSLSRNQINLRQKLKDDINFIDNFKSKILEIIKDTDKCFIFQWLLWISMDYIPTDKKHTLFTIKLNLDSNSLKINKIDNKMLLLPTYRQFYYPHFANIAFNVLILAKNDILTQQFGLCVLQNFVKSHVNREILCTNHNVNFLMHLIKHIENALISNDDNNNNNIIIQDYIFLLSVIGSAANNCDLKQILSLQSKITNPKYDSLVPDILIKILNNQNHNGFFQFQYNSYLKLMINNDKNNENNIILNKTQYTLIISIIIIILDGLIQIFSIRNDNDLEICNLCLDSKGSLFINIFKDNKIQSLVLLDKFQIGQVNTIKCTIYKKNGTVMMDFQLNHPSNCNQRINKKIKLTKNIKLNTLSIIIGNMQQNTKQNYSTFQLSDLRLNDRKLTLYSLSDNILDSKNNLNELESKIKSINDNIYFCKKQSLSTKLIQIGNGKGIPTLLLFEMITNCLTTKSLNHVLKFLYEIIDEELSNDNSNEFTVPLMNDIDIINVFAYSLKSVIHLADKNTCLLLLKLCGINDFKPMQKNIDHNLIMFNAIFLDSNCLKLWENSKSNTLAFVFYSIAKMISDKIFHEIVQNSNIMTMITEQIEEFSIDYYDALINLLRVIIDNDTCNNCNESNILIDTVICLKVNIDNNKLNNNGEIKKKKLILLLKLFIDIGFALDLKHIISLLQSSSQALNLDLTILKYILILALPIFDKSDKLIEQKLLILRDQGTVNAFIDCLKDIMHKIEDKKEIKIISIILLYIIIGNNNINDRDIILNDVIVINDNQLINILCKNNRKIILPEILLILLNDKDNNDNSYICKQILYKIKNWGSGCTLALILDITQLIFKLVKDGYIDNDNDNDNDNNVNVLQFFCFKAIRQLLKTQNDLEWFFIEILFVSTQNELNATQNELKSFHSIFLKSLLLHIEKYITYKTLKQNGNILTQNLILLFKISIGCFLLNTFTNNNIKILINTMICMIIRYSQSNYGSIPILLFDVFNKIIILILSQTYLQKNLNQTIFNQILNILLTNKKIMFHSINDNHNFYLTLIYLLIKLIFKNSSQTTKKICMKILEYLIISKQSILLDLFTFDDNNLFHDGFCQYLINKQYDKFEKWVLMENNQILIEQIFNLKCIQIYDMFSIEIENEFSILSLSTKPINNKRRRSTVIESENIKIDREETFKMHHIEKLNKESYLSVTAKSISDHLIKLKSEQEIFNLINNCQETIISKTKWHRDERYLLYPSKLRFVPICGHKNDEMEISINLNIKKSCNSVQFHNLLSVEPNYFIINDDKIKFRSSSSKPVKSPKIIYGHFKDISRNLILKGKEKVIKHSIMKRKRRRSASLSDIQIKSQINKSSSMQLLTVEPNSANKQLSFKNELISLQSMFDKKSNEFMHITHELRQNFLDLSSKIEIEFPCIRISIFAELNAVIIGTTTYLCLIQRNDDNNTNQQYKIKYNDIQHVQNRDYIHQSMGIEIISRRGYNFFLVLHTENRDILYKQIMTKCNFNIPFKNLGLNQRMNYGLITNKNNNHGIDGLNYYQQLWIRGELSNFDYLLYLNKYAGRSFLDVTQYPIFPWILNDYKSDDIDLLNSNSNNNKSIFRDLTVPMGALDKERLSKFIEQYKECQERKFFYGTHYSNPATIFHYLLRISPYTISHCQLQNGRFDHPDRLFHSIQEMYQHQSKKSFHAVRELIPEFFYFPQFLINGSKIDFGKRESDGKSINNVKLPPWAYNESSIFIEINRRALESEYVSNNLHHWIDLIFGYKQTGKEAEKAYNVFHPYTSKNNFDINSFDNDEILKQAAIEQVRSFGQTPKQIFYKPHPKKDIIYGNNNKYNKYPITNIIYDNKLHGIIKLYQLSVKIYSPLINKFVDIKSIEIDTNIDQVNNYETKNIFIGDIFCTQTKNDENYVPSIGYQRYINTPYCNFKIKYNLPHSSIQIITENNMMNNNTLRGLHTDTIICIDISSDGQTLITGGYDGLLRIWQIKFYDNNHDHNNDKAMYTRLVKIDSNLLLRLELISSVLAHSTPIDKVVFSRKYNTIITISGCKAVVFDSISLKCIHILKLKQKISAISQIRNYRFVLAFSSNFYVYNIYGSIIAKFEDSNHCIIDNNYNEITQILLPNQTGMILPPTIIGLKDNKHESFNDLNYSSSSSSSSSSLSSSSIKKYYTSCHIFSGHKNGIVRIWSLIYKPEINSFSLIRIKKLNSGHTAPITAINITGNGNILITGDKNGKLIEWGLLSQTIKAFYHNNNQLKKTKSMKRTTSMKVLKNNKKQVYDDSKQNFKKSKTMKEEIKSKYRAFQLHFNHVCYLQDSLQQMKKKNNEKEFKIIKNELISSLQILKRCKNELKDAKQSEPKKFCHFKCILTRFWDFQSKIVNQNDLIHFQLNNNNNNDNDNDDIIICYNLFGERVGIINNKMNKSLIMILIKEGILFEGIIGLKINNFEIEINVNGYSINNDNDGLLKNNILINKLKAIGIDLNKLNTMNNDYFL